MHVCIRCAPSCEVRFAPVPMWHAFSRLGAAASTGSGSRTSPASILCRGDARMSALVNPARLSVPVSGVSSISLRTQHTYSSLLSFWLLRRCPFFPRLHQRCAAARVAVLVSVSGRHSRLRGCSSAQSQLVIPCPWGSVHVAAFRFCCRPRALVLSCPGLPLLHQRCAGVCVPRA